MARSRTVFRCTECGGAAPQWAGRCPACGEWNTLVEEVEAPSAPAARVAPVSTPAPIGEVDPTEWQPRPTGIDELDRVLGGGLVPGSVTLLGGEPGIGKSTLLLQALASLAERHVQVLYVSGEESAQQVRLRAERLGALQPSLWFVAETDLAHVIAHLDQVAPVVCVVDSIQTMTAPDLTSSAGSVAQVRDCAARLTAEAKARGIATILVGHVTKDGGLAGPRVLEHVVDTVVSFEGERHHALRLLRAVKHRFGSTDELGLFEMTEGGLVGLPDPSKLFLADRRAGVSGSIVVPTIEGHRPLLVELQALVTDGGAGSPRRSAQGLDHGRMSFLLAVLQQRAGISVSEHDVYALAVGGVRLVEPAADLALAMAVASARLDMPVPDDLVAIGEVGLGGELRQVGQTGRRLAEAARLGFTTAIVPRSTGDAPPGVRLVRAATLADAVHMGLTAPGPIRRVR
ncbi:DNA repair protein RadA [Actinomarinicola tropica]|uniref:DNA repair protein RadA n=1 Tax=Actinomarinicola tropica TaxID=2789776 RepID=A0A5Q2RQQ8_9ACTN|nr:DNA repair protein RadA [Actinomarinicola tropica]QGG96477.1 DNA repair protein RadA [Actinomarinicola tropica]